MLDEAVAVAEKLAAAPALQMRLTRKLFRENALERNVNTFLQNETDAFIAMLRAVKKARAEAEAARG